MTDLQPPVQVVAGILHSNGRVLVCQRKNDAVFPLKWEFPGGKVEASESPEIALERELNEELGIKVLSATQVFSQPQLYPNGLNVFVKFYRVDDYKGTITNEAFQAVSWIEPQQLHRLDFLDGTRPIVTMLGRGELIKGFY